MKTYYDILGVARDASPTDIDNAYQRLKARYDIAGLEELDSDLQNVARQRLDDLERAYAVLHDPAQRATYDAGSPPAATTTPATGNKLSQREVFSIVGGIALALVLIGVVWMLTDRDNTLPSVGEVSRPAPDFTLSTLDGGTISLSDYRGKVVLVNFWGTWCEPCKRETPALEAAYQAMQDDGLVIIGINLTDDELIQGNAEADIQAFVDQYRVTYPIALDRDGTVLQDFRVYPLPTSFFVDPEGTIRYVRVGEITTDEVAALFADLRQTVTAQQE